jgi:hypothetical protein
MSTILAWIAIVVITIIFVKTFNAAMKLFDYIEDMYDDEDT